MLPFPGDWSLLALELSASSCAMRWLFSSSSRSLVLAGEKGRCSERKHARVEHRSQTESVAFPICLASRHCALDASQNPGGLHRIAPHECAWHLWCVTGNCPFASRLCRPGDLRCNCSQLPAECALQPPGRQVERSIRGDGIGQDSLLVCGTVESQHGVAQGLENRRLANSM